MKPIKRIVLSVCLLVCVFVMSSCDFPFRGSLSSVDLEEAYYILADNTINFTMYAEYDAVRFDFAEVMETDQYGRRLIRYCAAAPNSTKDETGDNVTSCLLICQKASNGFAYYYEDLCWIGTSFAAEKVTYADFSAEEISALKEKNDWGLPLDKSKMKQVCYGAPPRKPDLTGIRENVIKHFDLDAERSNKISFYPFGENSDGMYFVWIIVNTEHYFCVVDPADASIVLSKSYEGDHLQCQEAVHAFKSENGFIE